MQDNYYNKIKELLIDNEITKRVKNYSINKSDLNTYYSVGKEIVEAQGGEDKAQYGNKLIKEYSEKLTLELGKGYSWRNLYNMRSYYLFLSKNQILQLLAAKMNWTHLTILLSLKNVNEISYYMNQVISFNLGKRELQERIKSKEYERLDEHTRNKLIYKEATDVSDFIKNPIMIKNLNKYEEISEKTLQRIILEDISSFLDELGSGFSFIKNEYKIKLGNTYNYIDLLLYNYLYKCFIVIELKIIELKKEHIGQIQTYMNYIDKNVKTIEDNKTIGIIISKRNDKFVIEYCSDSRISFREYEIV